MIGGGHRPAVASLLQLIQMVVVVLAAGTSLSMGGGGDESLSERTASQCGDCDVDHTQHTTATTALKLALTPQRHDRRLYRLLLCKVDTRLENKNPTRRQRYAPAAFIDL